MNNCCLNHRYLRQAIDSYLHEAISYEQSSKSVTSTSSSSSSTTVFRQSLNNYNNTRLSYLHEDPSVSSRNNSISELEKLVKTHLKTTLNNETDILFLPSILLSSKSIGTILPEYGIESRISVEKDREILTYITSFTAVSSVSTKTNYAKYANEKMSLPLIPHAIVQYRCGDNIGNANNSVDILTMLIVVCFALLC